MNKYIKQIILTVSIVFASAITSEAQVNPKEKFDAFLQALHKNYVDTVDDDELVDVAIKAMLKELDPHSKYYSRPQYGTKKQSMSGVFTGIGIEYSMQNDTACVTQVIPEGPAEKAGILAGDRIIEIDSAVVAGKKLDNPDILPKLRGPRHTTVHLIVMRHGKQIPVAITRDFIPDRSIRLAYMLNDSIGYISLGIFNQTTREEVDTAIVSLSKKGMKTLILDLQNNGGGYVESALGVADEFLNRDQLVYYSVGQDKGKDYYYAGGSGRFPKGKLIVLINQATASASEIFTGAMQDWDRALVIGRRSFGKGLMQRPVPLFDGSVVELTGARYYTPTGRSLQKPYKHIDYFAEVENRFKTGEMTDLSKFKVADSLMYKTLNNKRSVYGGGGILPDVYIPVDPVEYSDWAKNVLGGNILSQATFVYVDQHRNKLKAKYADMAYFERDFKAPASAIRNIMKEANKQGFKPDKKDEVAARRLLSLEFKAQVAGQLYSGSKSYLRVLNEGNKPLLKALEVLQRDQYDWLLKQNHQLQNTKHEIK